MLALAGAPLLVSCSDDEAEPAAAADLYVPASIVDGVMLSGIETNDPDNSFVATYDADGAPVYATVDGRTFHFEYQAGTRAAATPTGKKLVMIAARDTLPDEYEASHVATNFAFNVDGFVASYQEITTESGPGYTMKSTAFYTFTYNNKGQIQRVGITGSYTETSDEETVSEPVRSELLFEYSGDALSRVRNTYDGETVEYLYEYATDTHANTYNKMTPQLATGMGVLSPVMKSLANMGYMGNASAFLPTKYTYHAFSDYADGDPNYEDTESFDISYRFWDNNRVRSISSSQNGVERYRYFMLYFDK